MIALTVLIVIAVLAAGSALVRSTRSSAAARAEGRPTGAGATRPGHQALAYVEVGAWSDRTYPSGPVVVGYDGRGHSLAAVQWAAHEASRRGRPLVVLHAADYPGMTGEPGPGLWHRDPGALEAAEEVTARGVAEALAVEPHLHVVGATEVTTAARALAEASRDAALVVVGSRGHGRVLGALRGSVAVDVAARAGSPLVVVTKNLAHRARARALHSPHAPPLRRSGPGLGNHQDPGRRCSRVSTNRRAT